MRNVAADAWGLPVGNLSKLSWINCQYLSPVGAVDAEYGTPAGDKSWVIRAYALFFTNSIPQPNEVFSHLLSNKFYLFSTEPITTNVMKGYKK